MNIQQVIFNSEVKSLLKKVENNYQSNLEILKGFLNYSSSFKLINGLKQLVKKVISFKKSKAKNEDEIENFYEEFQEIVINNFDEKKLISKNKHYQKNYETLFIFLTYFFKENNFL